MQDLHTEGSLVPEHLKGRMSFMDHDMFTEQPIKDAEVYFWRVVLHNWSDAFVVKALRSLIPALKLGAKVVIQDHGLADPGEGRLSDESYERLVIPSNTCVPAHSPVQMTLILPDLRNTSLLLVS